MADAGSAPPVAAHGSEDISYGAVAVGYAAGVAICAALWLAQLYTDAVHGMYVIFLPFLPALLWALLVRTRQQRAAALRAKADKAD